MANVNAPYGFISNDNMLSDDAESLQQYSVLDTNTHPIGQGDPVSVLNTGTVGRSAAGDVAARVAPARSRLHRARARARGAGPIGHKTLLKQSPSADTGATPRLTSPQETLPQSFP